MENKEPETPVYYCCGLNLTSLADELIPTAEDAKQHHVDYRIFKKNLGFHLHLDRIQFPGFHIQPGWLDKEFKIKNLQITRSNIFRIAVNAFNSRIFHTVIELELHDLPIKSLQFGIFNGLEQLQILTLSQLDLKRMDANIFETCPNIQSLYVFNSIRTEIDIKLLSGTYLISNLRTVQFSENQIADKIVHDTFYGLINVYALLLPENAITEIGEGAFEQVVVTLKFLDLSKNLLKTLHTDFYEMFYLLKPSVDLSENRWECDCDLEPLRRAYITSPARFQSQIFCDGKSVAAFENLCPDWEYDDDYVADSDDDDVIIQPSTSATLSPPSSPQLLSPPSPQLPSSPLLHPPKLSSIPSLLTNFDHWQMDHLKQNTISIMCGPSNKQIQMKKSTLRLVIGSNGNDEYFLKINKFTFQHIIIGFEIPYADGIIKKPTCITNNRNRNNDELQFPLKLQPNTLYQFCGMRKGTSFISSLNCFSFYSKMNGTNDTWIYLRNRGRVVIFCIISGLISISIGFGFVYIVSNLRPKLFITSKSKMMKQSEHIG